ncbi:macrophage mannose receptor 1-like [Simochromis diagramma]|uniref:macrophage mannose receptor 1-like n=1 Tax=Simochromis diagramma TaxID=43689 RepID=UPI001A7EA165|nr:macrophage mannose receptor 1-like [Simochromis diagramma]
MKQNAVRMMVLSGLCFLPVCFPRLYILVSQAKDWSSAKQFCRNTYTDLACVHNEKDLAMVNKLTKGLYSVWIGLQPDTEAWRWSLEYQNYYVEGGAEFRMWASNEPNVGPGYYKACVAMLPSGEWADQACGVTYPFICYYKNTSSFIYVNVSETWKNAQSYCRVKHTDLASVRNQSENEQLKMMLNNSPTWIGLYRNSWMWSDGSAYSFPNWAPNKPLSEDNYSCGTTYLEKWHNSACNGYNYFLCYTDVKDQRLLKVELKTTDASVDMEVLQNDILEKFNQRLMENGLSEFTLRWVKQLDGNIFHKKEHEEEKEETEEEICAVTLTL